MSLIFMLSLNTYAAQCKYLPKHQIKKVIGILEDHIKNSPIAVVDKYCEACMDERPEPMVLDKDSLKVVDFQVAGYKGLEINGQSIDLAYLYIGGENISHRIGCKAHAVSEYL